ncbi:hypothetical protein I4U23_015404 [Adineta vaga]|nr:hypothetical protein I4U23_015404 [Adineta vaga]
MLWIIIVLLSFSCIHSAIIGKIENYILSNVVTQSLLNQTRDQCLCQMMNFNTLISAINYFSQNQTCQLFSSNNNSITIQYQMNSTLIFINQSTISIQINKVLTLISSSTSSSTTSSTTTATTTAVPSTICISIDTKNLYNNDFIYSPTSQIYAAGLLNNQFGIYRAYGYGNVTTNDGSIVLYRTGDSKVMWVGRGYNSNVDRPFCLQMLDSGTLIWVNSASKILWTSNPS